MKINLPLDQIITTTGLGSDEVESCEKLLETLEIRDRLSKNLSNSYHIVLRKGSKWSLYFLAVAQAAIANPRMEEHK